MVIYDLRHDGQINKRIINKKKKKKKEERRRRKEVKVGWVAAIMMVVNEVLGLIIISTC